MLACAGACRAAWSSPPLLRIPQTLRTFPRSYKAAGRRTGTLRSDTTALLCLPFSTPAETQDGQCHQAVHFSAWPPLPWRTVLTQFGSERGGLVLSQEEITTARLLPLVPTSTSFHSSLALPMLRLLWALPGLCWAHSPLPLLRQLCIRQTCPSTPMHLSAVSAE